jgi:LacI family transcriptional regulator
LRLDLLLHIAGGAKNSFNYSSFGGILFADIIGNRHQVEGALHSQVPLVVLNYRADDLQASYIAIDNLKGAREAVEYLLNLGHRRIGIITGDLLTQAAQDRLQGYQEALQKKKIEPLEELIFKGDFSRRSARVGMHKLLKLKDPPTAIFACSDDMAKEAISVAMEIGSKVPEDISVVGFDDNPISLVGPVTLTTVRQPLVKMAEEGLKELGVLMRGEKRPLRKTLLPTELIVRDSCLPPR